MSLEFIQAGYNKSDLEKAVRQEKQLAYFTESKIQDTYLSELQIKQWAKKNYQTNDHFLNWVKSIFLTENFSFFVKYLRFPLQSAKLVKNVIEPQLNRVFVSDNSYFDYGSDEDFNTILDIDTFETKLFYNYLYAHNSVLISDIKDDKPYRYFVEIEDVLSIKHNENKITAIAFNGSYEGSKVRIYIDSEKYCIYKNETLVKESIHNLGYCPATFIAPEFEDEFVIRRSIFSYIREDLENYVYLSVLLKQAYSNGIIPIVSSLDVQIESENQQSPTNQPNSDYIIGSQAPSEYSTTGNQATQTSGILQPGSVNKIPVMRKDDGSVDMEAVKYFINFHYLPVENIKKLEERVNEIRKDIISTIIGDVVSSNESSKNELQVGKSIIVLENTLISLADDFNVVRYNSDKAMLDLKNGVGKIEPKIFYGTSFFLQNESELMNQFATAPNPLERRNILETINKNKFKNNQDLRQRATILYKLMPFVSDKDYEQSSAKGLVDKPTSYLYLQFNKWISKFEAEYGDIVIFANTISKDKNEALIVINNLLLEMINNLESEVTTKDKPLAIELGVGGTQALQGILIDPVMSIESKINTIVLLFGINEVDAKKMVGETKVIPPAYNKFN